MNADGSGQRRLSREREPGSLGAAWSPDGRTIALTSNRDGNQEIYVINANAREQRRLTRHPAWDGSPAWSPDGQKIAFARSRDGRVSDIHLMNADGSGQRRLTQRGTQPRWSPDGGKIAFRSGRGGNLEVYVMNADGTEQQRLTRNPARSIQFIAWSPAPKAS
jgi:Tol biopolymer transport system component